MANEPYAFDENGMRKVVALVRRLEREVRTLRAEVGQRRGAGFGKLFLARVGDDAVAGAQVVDGRLVPGEADATLWKLDKDDKLEELTNERTFFNESLAPIPRKSFVKIAQEHTSGRFVALCEGLRCARLTEAMNDETPAATANVWEWEWTNEEETEGDWVETEEEVLLRSFLLPEGEEIPDRTRVFFAQIGEVLQVIVANCAPDPEEETP